jgi:hypothetical protein
MFKENIAIEVLGSDNIWRRMKTGVINNPQIITTTLIGEKRVHQNSRVRAVGQNSNQLIDMLM